MPGRTAYFGLLREGKPSAGETLVVSAASGAVGSVVGQIGKMERLTVVGVAGGPEKCAWVKDELGFDDCIDYKADDLDEALRKACPNGIDIYFESVGGALAEAVSKQLNPGARVPICGYISNYNSKNITESRTPFHIFGQLEHPPWHQFFLVFDYVSDYAEANQKLIEWVASHRMGRFRQAEIPRNHRRRPGKCPGVLQLAVRRQEFWQADCPGSRTMKGDSIIVEEHHRKAASGIVPVLLPILQGSKQRYTISVAGQSGAGKSETAMAIALSLAGHGIESVIFQQDDYLMDEHLAAFLEGVSEIEKPLVDYHQDAIGSEEMEPGSAQVAIADGTYTTLLKEVMCHVFIDRDYLETRAHREKRRRDDSELDPFIDRVLEIEHDIISSNKALADIVCNR